MTPEFRPGVLSRRQLLSLCEESVIQGSPDSQAAASLSAFDLTLSAQGWKMRGAIKGNPDQPYSEILTSKDFVEREFDINHTTTLEPLCTYVFRVKEKLDLSRFPNLLIYGHASGKSSVGRLDVLVRLIADYSSGYDEVRPPPQAAMGYPLSLYAEVTPISFHVRVHEGIALNQLRLFAGRPEWSELTADQLSIFPSLLFNRRKEAIRANSMQELSVDVSAVELGKNRKLSGYEAKEGIKEPLDLTSFKKLDPAFFWDLITPRRNKDDLFPDHAWTSGDTLFIKPNRFYILRSQERFRLPLDIAAFVHPMTESVGDIRIHYAGFIHPGFGLAREEGTPLIFEVRAYNVPTFLRHGEKMAVIKYHRMSEAAEGTDSARDSYQGQELTLSKFFKPWK